MHSAIYMMGKRASGTALSWTNDRFIRRFKSAMQTGHRVASLTGGLETIPRREHKHPRVQSRVDALLVTVMLEAYVRINVHVPD